MEARRRQAGRASQVGDLQRMAGVALDEGVQAGQRQAQRFGRRGIGAGQAGEQQQGALARDHRILQGLAASQWTSWSCAGLRAARRAVRAAGAGHRRGRPAC
jgi:hypothetical protein